jgi:cytochrome P450
MPEAYTFSLEQLDLYSDAVLENPYPAFKILREQGPAVWLPKHHAYAVPRYSALRKVLADYETFSSARGAGLNDTANSMMAGAVLATDPPEHDKLRSVLAEELGPHSMRNITQQIQTQADALVEKLWAQKTFDAVADFARVFPLEVVADLIGLPEEGRDQLLDWADATFNTFGPENPRFFNSLGRVNEMMKYAFQTAVPGKLRPGSMGAAIYSAAERGIIRRDQCGTLMTGYLTGGLDTTIHSLGHAILLFGMHPEQWDALKSNPSVVPSAYAEILRFESPVYAFTRYVTKDSELMGVPIPQGSRVILLYGAANRDERKYPDPERFDVRRNPVDHLAFGYGVHACAGQGLARLEAHCLLNSLLRRVERFEIGKPVRHLNNAVRGLEELPVTIS